MEAPWIPWKAFPSTFVQPADWVFKNCLWTCACAVKPCLWLFPDPSSQHLKSAQVLSLPLEVVSLCWFCRQLPCPGPWALWKRRLLLPIKGLGFFWHAVSLPSFFMISAVGPSEYWCYHFSRWHFGYIFGLHLISLLFQNNDLSTYYCRDIYASPGLIGSCCWKKGL